MIDLGGVHERLARNSYRLDEDQNHIEVDQEAIAFREG